MTEIGFRYRCEDECWFGGTGFPSRALWLAAGCPGDLGTSSLLDTDPFRLLGSSSRPASS